MAKQESLSRITVLHNRIHNCYHNNIPISSGQVERLLSFINPSNVYVYKTLHHSEFNNKVLNKQDEGDHNKKFVVLPILFRGNHSCIIIDNGRPFYINSRKDPVVEETVNFLIKNYNGCNVTTYYDFIQESERTDGLFTVAAVYAIVFSKTKPVCELDAFTYVLDLLPLHMELPVKKVTVNKLKVTVSTQKGKMRFTKSDRDLLISEVIKGKNSSFYTKKMPTLSNLKSNCLYVVDEVNVNCDYFGAWKRTGQYIRYYEYQPETNKVGNLITNNKDGTFEIKSPNGSQPPQEFDINRNTYIKVKSRSFNNKTSILEKKNRADCFKKKIFEVTVRIYDKTQVLTKGAIYYNVEKIDSKLPYLPHGNVDPSRHKTSKPYIRSDPEVKRKIESMLGTNTQPSMIAHQIRIQNKAETSPNKKLKSCQQVYDTKWKSRQRATKLTEYEELCALQQEYPEFIQSIIQYGENWIAVCGTPQQFEDMSIFSTQDGKPVPFQIDLTYNLLKQYITDISMRNRRLLIQGSDGNFYHPFWLMPFCIHQVKDEDAYYLMSHVLINKNKKIKQLKYMLSDLDTSFFNGFKRNIPNLQALWCNVHMRKNDENQMFHEQKKQPLSDRQKEVNRKIISKTIYGWKSSNFCQPGIIHLKSEKELMKALDDVKEDWNSRIPLFHEWFLKNRVKHIIMNLKQQNIEDDGISMLTTNGVESMHSLEKRLGYHQNSPGWSKKSDAGRLRECIQTLYQVVQYQYQQEEEAIVNLGQYILSDDYKEFDRDLQEWCSDSTEKENEAHLKLFRSC